VSFEALASSSRPILAPRWAPESIPIEQLGRHAAIVSLVATPGVSFIALIAPSRPTTNSPSAPQRRPASGGDGGIAQRTGIRKFFGTDDNFFNHARRAETVFSTMARGTVGNRPFRKAISFATEATEADVKEPRPPAAGCAEGRAASLWFGIEDRYGRVGQGRGKTPEKPRPSSSCS